MMFRQTLGEAVARGKLDGSQFAVLFIDLDRFKIVNDTLGHAAGDDLLRQVSGRLASCVAANDTLARLGGDEFIVLLRQTSDREEIAAIARKLLSAAILPMIIQGQQCHVTASIGVSMFPADAADEETLIRNADVAMYAAKEQGRNNFCFHSKEMGTKSLERLVLELKRTAARLRDRPVDADRSQTQKTAG
jgi:diguanylate cyclase (GGDEF)-like protein